MSWFDMMSYGVGGKNSGIMPKAGHSVRHPEKVRNRYEYITKEG